MTQEFVLKPLLWPWSTHVHTRRAWRSGSLKPGVLVRACLISSKAFCYYFTQQRLLLSPLCFLINEYCQNGEVRYPNLPETCGPEKFLNLALGGGKQGWQDILPFLRAELTLSLGIWNPRYLTFFFMLFKRAPLWCSSIWNPQALLGSHWGFFFFFPFFFLRELALGVSLCIYCPY